MRIAHTIGCAIYSNHPKLHPPPLLPWQHTSYRYLYKITAQETNTCYTTNNITILHIDSL